MPLDPRVQRFLTILAAGNPPPADQASVAEVQKLTNDPDTEVAKEALKALRTLQARE